MVQPIRAIRVLALLALSALMLDSLPAAAQTRTVGGVFGSVLRPTSTLLRETTLNLPAFRINPLAGTQNFQVGVTYQGTTRVFYVIRPTATVSNAPVLFLLHGRGMTGDRMANYTAAAELVRDFGIWVILPQAAGSTGQWAEDPADSGTADDVGFLTELMNFALINYPLNPRRLYFAGLSSGGFMSNRMACRTSNRIAAIFSVAAGIRAAVRPECTATRPMPVGIVNGTLDTIVPYDGIPSFLASNPPNLTSAIDTAGFWVERNGCSLLPVEMLALPDASIDNTTVSRRRYLGCSADRPVTLYTVTGGGHTWPGTPFATYTIGLGPTSQDVSATRLAWDFVSPHALP